MELLVLTLILTSAIVVGAISPDVDNQPVTIDLQSGNTTDDSSKEMYVIHATVYQVGIITNKTYDDENNTGIIGNQEAITFYNNNGSNIDLSDIPAPLVTNVTAQTLVGVAPAPTGNNALSWPLNKLVSGQNYLAQTETPVTQQFLEKTRKEREVKHSLPEIDSVPYLKMLFKRSSEQNMEEEKSPVKIVSGGAIIPQDAGVHSIAIPPLLTLNNNFSDIPVPIPNTSVVQYAKVNTLIRKTIE